MPWPDNPDVRDLIPSDDVPTLATPDIAEFALLVELDIASVTAFLNPAASALSFTLLKTCVSLFLVINAILYSYLNLLNTSSAKSILFCSIGLVPSYLNLNL